jgi:hypothetical protein
MDRRNFLKLSGVTGLSLLLPWGSSSAHADQATWGGPYFLHMHAGGGWDPTLFCDGKLTASGSTPAYENRLITGVQDVNGIPVPAQTAAGKYLMRDNGQALEDPVHFFQNIGRSFLVLNGVDTQTNNHDTGLQGLACGHNDIELPALAALLAGSVAKQRDVPMAFLAGGQYNRTGDVVGISRFPGDKVPLLADPFRAYPGEERALISDVAQRRIQELRAERLGQLAAQASLPRNKRTLKAAIDATRGGGTLNLLKDVAGAAAPSFDTLSAGLAPDTRDYWSQDVGNKTSRFVADGRNLETILRCFQAGISVSATYADGNFDTHAQHDDAQPASLGRFVSRLRYVMLRAEQLGIKDKLFVVVTSDFGRTPKYNTGNGKDHWNVTSVLVSGPGIQGGRAIGKTDEGHRAMRVNASNVTQTLAAEDNAGTRILPQHIHREMRRVLGVDKADFINQFPLPAGEILPVLG